MTNAELITAMRICANQTCCDNCPRYDIDHTQDAQMCCVQLINDAAAALEAAEQRTAELGKQHGSQLTRNIMLTAKIPKEGEWIGNSRDFHCSMCGVYQNFYTGKSNYCPNCGARMQTVTDCHTLEEGER